MILDLAKLRAETLALIDGTTPGPWDGVGLTVYDTCLDGVASCHTGADARLIAAAPTLAADTLRLLDEIERLTSENERLRGEDEGGFSGDTVGKQSVGHLREMYRAAFDALGSSGRVSLRNFIDNRIRAEIAAAERKGAEAWQPIETAPRDDSDFLAFWPHDTRPKITWFCETEGCFYCEDEEADLGGIYAPTCWTPLPLPPSTREGE